MLANGTDSLALDLGQNSCALFRSSLDHGGSSGELFTCLSDLVCLESGPLGNLRQARPKLLKPMEVLMVRNIIALFVIGISAFGLIAFAGNDGDTQKLVGPGIGTIRLDHAMTGKGAAIKVTAGDLVFFAPSLVLPAQEKTKWVEVSPVGGKLLVPRMLTDYKATSGTFSTNSLTISIDAEVWRAHAGQPNP
jgi:hypothetical protein